MFTPTKQDLEEMGFRVNDNYWGYEAFHKNPVISMFVAPDERLSCYIYDSEDFFQSMKVYPKSLQDIKSLIHLLTE